MHGDPVNPHIHRISSLDQHTADGDAALALSRHKQGQGFWLHKHCYEVKVTIADGFTPSRLSKLLIWTLTFPSSNQTRRYWLVELERTRSKPCERRVRTNMDTVLLSPGLSSTVNTAWLSRSSLPNLAVTYSDNTKVNSWVRERYNKEYAQDCFCDCCSVYALSKWYAKMIFSDFFLLFIT